MKSCLRTTQWSKRQHSLLLTSKWGEEVAALVVLKWEATEANLIQYCRDHLSDFKCPKTIRIVDSIPRTATGKIQRSHLSSMFSDVNPSLEGSEG